MHSEKMVKYALSALFHYFKQFAIARKLNKNGLEIKQVKKYFFVTPTLQKT